MPWCPNCRTEYIPGITRCADCGAELVPELPKRPAAPPLETRLLTTVRDNSEFAMIKGLLDSAGIPFYRVDRGGGGYLRITMGFSVFEQELYVDARRYDEAKELLRAYCNRREVMVFEDDENLEPEPEAGPGAWQFYVGMLAAFALLFLWAVAAGYF